MRRLEKRGLFDCSEPEKLRFTWRFEFSGKQNRPTSPSNDRGRGRGRGRVRVSISGQWLRSSL